MCGLLRISATPPIGSSLTGLSAVRLSGPSHLDFASLRVGFGRASSLWSGFPTQLLDKTRRA
jgi:hypothetical protein